MPCLFFADPSYEPFFSLPPVASSSELTLPIYSDQLRTVWFTLRDFSVAVNGAVGSREKVPDRMLLETMASTMYELLHLCIAPGSADELVYLAMLAFGASVSLHWRHLRMPLQWLQSRYWQALQTMKGRASITSTPSEWLWYLSMYTVAFPSLTSADGEMLQAWVADAATAYGPDLWISYKSIMKKFLWIDIVCDSAAKESLTRACEVPPG